MFNGHDLSSKMKLDDFEENVIFFEKALQNSLDNKSIRVIEVAMSTGLSKGSNFMSELFKVPIRYTRISENGKIIEESTILVVKIEPTTGGENFKMIKDQQFFANEIKVLRKALPRIEKIVGQKLGPRLIYHWNKPFIIIMEDLSLQGFVMTDRQKGLSKKHTLLALDCIAKFHAGSVKLCEEEPDTLKSFTGGIFTKSTHKNMYTLMEQSFVSLSEKVKMWPDIRCVRASDKIRSMKNDFRTRIMDTYKYDEGEFCVLNHGDYWTNNMLFKENDTGEPCDVLMVDYQMSIYTSPAIDLHYMLNICPSEELKCDMDYFLEYYLKTLSSCMKMVNCETQAPTMEQLKYAMFKRRLYGVTAGLVFFPRMNSDDDQVEDFNDILLTGLSKMDICKNAVTVQSLRKMIPAMEDKGYFD